MRLLGVYDPAWGKSFYSRNTGLEIGLKKEKIRLFGDPGSFLF
jgi:hypothetical protein